MLIKLINDFDAPRLYLFKNNVFFYDESKILNVYMFVIWINVDCTYTLSDQFRYQFKK